MKDTGREICQKIREIRKSMNLTQDQFAELCDISVDSVGKIERNVYVPSVETLYKIARRTKKPIDAILPTIHREKTGAAGLPQELSNLVDYLRVYPPEDVKFLHELAVKIFERKSSRR